MVRASGLAACGLVLAFVACENAGVIGPEPPVRPLGKSLAALQVAGGCDDVLAALKSQEVEAMKARLAQSKEAALQANKYGWCWAEEDFGGGFLNGQPTPGASGGAKSYSQTNTQVAGVDEADFVKNDGSYIYAVADGALQIVAAWPAPDMHMLSVTKVEGEPKKLYVHNNRALVFSALGPVATAQNDYGPWGYYGGMPYYQGSGECTYGYDCDFTGDGQVLKMTILDISDKAHPVVVRETTFSGSYLNSRRIGDVVHTVVVFPEVSVPGVSYFPQELKDVYGWCGGGDTNFTDDEIVAMFALLEEKNVQTIANATISQFLPGIKDIRWYGSEKTVEEGLLQDCKDFYLAKAADGSSFLSLASLDIDDQGAIGVTTIVGKPGAVYASFDALYIAQRHYPENLGGAWFYDESEGIKEATTVHKFALTGGIGSEYRGSGAVKGRILNQFAMDEKDGVLRIATSMGHVPDPDCYSTVATLAESQGELVVLGMADHIAPTEDIRSVRFDGDLGFVVTFKKTDPLFVIDLSVPDNPVVKGELKIPGFSTYMHMIDHQHILSIGYDADDQGSFAWFQGIMLQVMDVSDMANPKLIHKEVIGSRGSTSDAATNHLAFTFFRDRNLLGLPMTICEGGSGGSYGNQMTFSGLLVYRVTVDKGFEKMGGIPHVAPQDFADYQACGNWWTNSNSLVKRSVFMDDWVYSIALDQIKTANLLDLANPVASVSLDVP